MARCWLNILNLYLFSLIRTKVCNVGYRESLSFLNKQRHIYEIMTSNPGSDLFDFFGSHFNDIFDGGHFESEGRQIDLQMAASGHGGHCPEGFL